MGLLHTGILNSIENVKIVGIVEKEKIIASYVKNLMPDMNVYNDYKKMFEAEELDLVYITTPISLHFPIMLHCIKDKVNFFVEKPLTGNLEESEKLCGLLKTSRIIHGVGYNRRFVSTFSKAKYMLDMGILGVISYVKSSMYVSNILSKPTGWRSKKSLSGGGVLMDLGAHVIDLLVWYHSYISRVSGKVQSIYSNEVEDSVQVNMEFTNGIKGELDTSWSKKGYRLPELNIEITGSKGKLRVNEDFIKLDLRKSDSSLDVNTTIYKQSLSDGVVIDLVGPEYTKEDVYMVDCVLNKTQTFVNAFEASKTQSIIQAIYASAMEGQEMKVKYFS